MALFWTFRIVFFQYLVFVLVVSVVSFRSFRFVVSGFTTCLFKWLDGGSSIVFKDKGTSKTDIYLSGSTARWLVEPAE